MQDRATRRTDPLTMCLVYGCHVEHTESHPVTAAASVAAQQRILAQMRDRIDHGEE